MLKIITDSSSNITPAEAEALGVGVLPLTVVFGDEELRDGVDVTAEQFYERLKSDKNHPHTSQINVAAFEEIFTAAKAAKETLLVMPISSALSGTYGAALTAKDNVGYDGVYVYDTLTTTVMLRILVLEAAKHADRPAPEVIAMLDELRARTELYAMVDTLEYLYRGGRLSRGTAVVGSIFHVKPIVTLTADGKVELCDKAIGTRCALKHIRKFTVPAEIDYDYPVYYLYTENTEKCEKLIDEIHPGDLEYLRSAVNLCPVIGVHAGPGAAGICFVRKKKV